MLARNTANRAAAGQTGRGAASTSSPAQCGFTSNAASAADAGPEWTTERWKHRVEAEARHRLKDEVRQIAAFR